MIAEISVVPVGEEVDLASHVAKVVKVIHESGLDYKLNAMSTVVEGDSDSVFDLIKKCHTTMLETAQRVYTVIKLDERKDTDKKVKMIEHKVRSVEKELEKILKK
ncbi:MAG: thiamine-binding protein [Candidatus Jettenia sp.]|uniref:Thiamine-binding protein domain-containing protein n=1 Tax=Candidatus Jettenia caeni TaxID=247490 RepID=I3IRH4_9BACT|nr:MTH1187 family thiamine-binding protein [Candidatus Jettenia sp. AMX1]MBC6928373.1 thiamine-binding protein [Candidatus Jettenia sp.]NUN24704.1 MTH1187 family thiamine-binding protein [Candidatus Jettenia caeni]KAA0250507.1 MAG: MTH1187 family thiamine-binding protein [Candidatus Jettenia sp. AMX1]MCE7879696.1 thiamine-binding protein [Candidatus Jettenia sp. AMX1]MCQ3926564.1 thiamine-binding protein [Candidatus Jettenia sp.]